jgi:hypothetical protein
MKLIIALILTMSLSSFSNKLELKPNNIKINKKDVSICVVGAGNMLMSLTQSIASVEKLEGYCIELLSDENVKKYIKENSK